MKHSVKQLTCLILMLVSLFIVPVNAKEVNKHHQAASNFTVVNYARSLLLSIVDDSFRGSWVIDPEHRGKFEKTLHKPFESLAKVKVGASQLEVKEILGTPKEYKSNGKLWVYGNPLENGTYEDLLEVFFDDTRHVIGIISFNPNDIDKKIGVTIGDPIDKMINIFNEPVDEKDFIEDPDNKDYLGLYYLYPRSGIGFLLGQDKSEENNLLVQGVLVFGKQ